MTRSEAVETLREGGSTTALAEAVGVLIADTRATDEELLVALKHRGFVAEEAALALHRRKRVPLEGDHHNASRMNRVGGLV